MTSGYTQISSRHCPTPEPMRRPAHRFATAVSMAALGLLCSASAMADVVGMRVAVTQTNQVTGDVDFDATAFMIGSPPEIQIGLEIDRTINLTYTTVLANYYGLGSVNYLIQAGSRSDFNTLPHPAIAYGDGSTAPTATLAWIGGVDVGGTTYQGYRGSFSHTYPNAGVFDLRVFAGPDGEGGTLGNPGLGPASQAPVTGNAIAGTLNNVFSISRFVAPTSNTASPVVNTNTTTAFSYPDTIRYITARTLVSFGPTTGTTGTTTGTTTGGGGNQIIEVPTLSETWLLILAAALAASGALLLRKR